MSVQTPGTEAAKPVTSSVRSAFNKLRAVKLLHTVIWAFFVGCIITIPLLAWEDKYVHAAVLSGIVLLEGMVLLLNRWRCPLTDVAARYTDDRQDNFDIYLPEWLARHNKLIFGALYVAGMVFAVLRWTVGP